MEINPENEQTKLCTRLVYSPFFCHIDLMANDVRLSQRIIRKIMFSNGRLAQDTGFI